MKILRSRVCYKATQREPLSVWFSLFLNVFQFPWPLFRYTRTLSRDSVLAVHQLDFPLRVPHLCAAIAHIHMGLFSYVAPHTGVCVCMVTLYIIHQFSVGTLI